MTALSEYQRLEATALWRSAPDAQRREVIVVLGDATLTISDLNDKALAHWSLAAVERLNPGKMPAIFHPDGDTGETLEVAESEAEMIDAIERLRQVIEKRRPKPGRLRLFFLATSFAAVAVGTAVWLPDALVRHTVSVVPSVKRAEIGEDLLTRISRVAGRPCVSPDALPALRRLSSRLLGDNHADALVVLRSGMPSTVHLPGGHILINSAIIEDTEDPNVPAGYIIAETVRSAQEDPLEVLLESAGTIASFRLLTTGNLDDATLQAYSETLLTQEPTTVASNELLGAFGKASVPSTPFAYAVDVSGETTFELIEADPFATAPTAPVMSDGDWVRLQGICGA